LKFSPLSAADMAIAAIEPGWFRNVPYLGTVKPLVEKGADVSSKDTEYSRTWLWWAATKGDEAVVKLLLEKGADAHSKDTEGRTPLSGAAEKGHETAVKLLLEKGADVEHAGPAIPYRLCLRF
jgi:ankyrin repeat protein